MKRLKILLGIWLLANLQITSLSAATLTAGEWFLDLDPGEGQGTPITGVSGSSTTKDIVIAPATIDALEDGPHLLGVRFQDDVGSWGQTSWRLFLVTHPSDNLVQGEYFFDQDPGEGQGTSITEVSGPSTTKDIVTAPTTIDALEDGPHLLGVRFQDDAGSWGQTSWRLFLVTHPGDSLIQGEYFFNQDPGEGSATPLGGISGSSVAMTPVVSLESLPTGANLLCVRFKNSTGSWSQVSHRVFLNPEPSKSPLNRIEFVLLRETTTLSSGSLLGDGSLIIDLAHVSLEADPAIGETLILQLQAVDEGGLRGHKVFRKISIEDFSTSFLNLFFTSAEQSSPSSSGDTADADGDGISNLIEQAAGLHPRKRNSVNQASGLDTPTKTKKNFRFRAASESIFDAASSTFSLGSLRFEIEISNDAQTWTRAISPTDFTIAPESESNEDGSFTHILNLENKTALKQFQRLKITRQ